MLAPPLVNTRNPRPEEHTLNFIQEMMFDQEWYMLVDLTHLVHNGGKLVLMEG